MVAYVNAIDTPSQAVAEMLGGDDTSPLAVQRTMVFKTISALFIASFLAAMEAAGVYTLKFAGALAQFSATQPHTDVLENLGTYHWTSDNTLDRIKPLFVLAEKMRQYIRPCFSADAEEVVKKFSLQDGDLATEMEMKICPYLLVCAPHIHWVVLAHVGMNKAVQGLESLGQEGRSTSGNNLQYRVQSFVRSTLAGVKAKTDQCNTFARDLFEGEALKEHVSYRAIKAYMEILDTNTTKAIALVAEHWKSSAEQMRAQMPALIVNEDGELLSATLARILKGDLSKEEVQLKLQGFTAMEVCRKLYSTYRTYENWLTVRDDLLKSCGTSRPEALTLEASSTEDEVMRLVATMTMIQACFRPSHDVQGQKALVIKAIGVMEKSSIAHLVDPALEAYVKSKFKIVIRDQASRLCSVAGG